MAYDDITKTGARNFRDLQLENDAAFSEAVAAKKKLLSDTYKSSAKSKEFDPYENAEQKVRSSLYGAPTGWGESTYDETDHAANANEFEQIADTRAKNQPWYSKLAAGVGKGVGLAGTTFIDGTLGLIVGGTEAIVNGDISKIWDNEVSNGLHDLNQAMEEWMPNYRSTEEQNKAWYENLGTINFWADSFIKNIGFTVGAFYSGNVWAKGLKLAGQGLQALGKMGEAYKIGRGTEALGVAMQTSGLGAKLTGSLISAVNEGRVEANNNTHDLRDLQVQQASDAAAKRREEILQDSSLSEEERVAQLEELDTNYNTTLEQIDDNLKKAGLTDFLLNVPILALDNFWTFGRMYAQGFQNARNTAAKNVKKSLLSRTSTAANEAADAAENTIATNTKKEGNRYLWDTISKKKSVGKGLLTGLREGNEEMMQGFAAEFAGNWNFYKDGPDAYYRAMANPKSLQDTRDSWEAASQAFADTYGNLDKYEEFAVGALTGLLGTPTFGKTQNSSANTYLGRGKMVGLSGGIFGEISADNETNKIGSEHVSRMNAALDKRDQIDRITRIHSALSQFNDVMNGFAEANDKFEFNNESDNVDWMGITSFISAGREEDLKTLIGQDFENLTDQELEAIASAAAQNDDGSVGGFRERGSNSLITATSPQEDKDTMRKSLAEKRDKMLEKIDEYKKSLSIIRNYAAGNPNVTEGEVNELAWMHWKVNRFGSRAKEIKERDAEKFISIAQALEDFNKAQQEILDTQEKSTEGLSPVAMSVVENKNTQLAEQKKRARQNLEYTKELLGVINSVASSNKQVMTLLAPMLKMDKGFLEGILSSDNFYDLAVREGLSKPEFDKAIRDIRDLARLAEASKTFNDKLKEYMNDPFKQKKDHDIIDQENETIATEINKETKRKKAKQVTRQQMLSREVNPDDVINNTRADDLERIAAKDAQVTIKVQQRLESLIASQNQAGKLSDEESVVINAALDRAISRSKSINDLTGTSAAFMIGADGQPLTDEQIALIQDLVDKAVKDVAESENLKIADGNIDFKNISEIADSRILPSDEETDHVEEIIKKTDTTGNDAVEKIAASNNGVPRTKKSVKKKADKKESNKKKNLKQQKKKTKNKKVPKESDKERAEIRKRGTVSAALTYAINGNTINNMRTEEGKQASQLMSNILSRTYDLINEGKVEKLSGVYDILKATDEWEKLQQLLGRTPALSSAITSISQTLNKEFAEESDDQEDDNLEEKLGPETTEGEIPAPTDFSSQNLNPTINIPNYFAPATSQFYRDPKTGQIFPVPFTARTNIKDKARKKKLEETYNYLQKLGAFQNAASVEMGDDIYFTVHPTLNNVAGGVVILMSTDPKGEHIVGDLADTDSYTYENNPLLHAMIDRITEEFNNRENKDSADPFVSKEQSSVRQTMVGHVMFTDSKSKSSDNSLNRVFGDGEFKMGVVNRAGRVITTNQGDESISNDIDVVTPKTRFTPGTPVVLIPSGKGTNKYIAVPFQMSRYGHSMTGTKFSRYVETLLSRVLLGPNRSILDLSSTKAQLMVKDALNALFNGDFHVNFNNGQLVIHQTIKTVKDGVVSKKNEYLFRGTPDASIVTSLIKSLQDKGMTIRIDRREINRNEKLKDLDFSYNNMIGDLAHTNLSEQSSTTVNDWFIVNPVNKQGKEIKIDRVEYRGTRGKDGPIQRNDTRITYKGTEYLVSEENKIVNDEGTPVSGIDAITQQIILAKAEVEKNDVLVPIGTEGEQIYWYIMSNGSLFYNKENEEKILSDKQEIQDAINDLKTPKDPLNKTPTANQDDPKEGQKNHYPKGFNSQKLKDFYDNITPAQRDVLKNAKPNALKAVIPKIKETMSNFDVIDLEDAEDEINDILDIASSTKYREVSEEEYTPVEIEKELSWLKKALPQLSDEDHLRIVKSLIKIVGKENPGYAYGKTQQGIMTISEAAASGTVYHEAFHAVIDTLLNEQEIETLFNRGSKKYGIVRDSHDNEIAIEESLAEDFRRFVQKEQKYQEDLEQSSGMSKIFKVLKHTVKTWLNNTLYINNMFYRINKGEMARRSIYDRNRGDRYNQYTEEERQILNNAPRDTVYKEHDGINHQNGEELIIWDSNKVKSATDNVGTFSRENDDIRYREAEVESSIKEQSKITSEDIQRYHRKQLDYNNLDNSQKELLEERGITEEQYEFLTQAERENLKQCLI